MTYAQAKRMGYRIVRGSYSGTCDDRIDRWYIDHEDDTVVDHRGPGHQTRAEALRTIADYIALTK